MKKRKILLIVIPVLIVLLILLGGFVFLKMNSTPKKIFSEAITSTFAKIKEKQPQDYLSRVKSNIELSTSIESNDESLKSINKELKDLKFVFNSEVDLQEAMINQDINITKNEENLLDAKYFMQDEKHYVYLVEWFDKQIELPLDENIAKEIKDTLKSVNSVNKILLIDAIEQEVKAQIANQDFEGSNSTITIEGQALKVKKSSLVLNEEQFLNIKKEFLLNLKNNADFQTALGDSKDSVLAQISSMIQNIQEETPDNDITTTFSIYTKGLKNSFVAFQIMEQKNDEIIRNAILTKVNENKNQFAIIDVENGENKEVLSGTFEKYDTEGILSISIQNDTKIAYKYKKTNLQTNYEFTVNNEEATLNITGGIIKTDNKYNGNFILVFENKQNDKYSINGIYNIDLNAQIRRNLIYSVELNNLTKEEEEEITNKIKDSKIYKIINENQDAIDVISESATESNTEDDSKSTNTSITNGSYVISYKEPELYKVLLDGKGRKEYYDDKGNRVKFGFTSDFDSYVKDIEKKKVEVEDKILNVQVSQAQEYKSKNNIEYIYRIITFEEKNSSEQANNGVNLYFVHKIDDNSSFYLEMESLAGDFDMQDIDTFLNITIE